MSAKRLAQRMIAAEDAEAMPQPPVQDEEEPVEDFEKRRAEYEEAWRVYQAHHEPEEEERVRLTRERVEAENALAPQPPAEEEDDAVPS